MGRKTVVDQEAVALLQNAFMEGANISQACLLANISRDAYYDRLKIDPDFSDKMDVAQNHVSLLARKNLVNAIKEGNNLTSLTWLERKDKQEFAPRTELTGSEGAPLGYVHSGDLKQIEAPEVKQLPPHDPSVE